MSVITNDAAQQAAKAEAMRRASQDAAKQNSLGQEDFLKLLTTQLSNQDPLKPLDSTQFVSQLAQFSQVSGVQEMNASLASLTESIKGTAVLDGASLVGRYVLLEGTEAPLDAEGTVVGAVDVPAGASNVKLNIRNASGELVRTIDVPTNQATPLFSWDGLANDGTTAPAGDYTFEAVATVGGKGQAATVMVADLVNSVSIDPGSYALTLNTSGQGAVRLADVRQVF